MVLDDVYGIVETSEGYAVCFRDNNTLWWDFRKKFPPKERARHKYEKHICLDRELFQKVIGYFWLTTRLMESLENMVTTPALSQEFDEKTRASLEKELGASLEVAGRKGTFDFAAGELSQALRDNEYHFSAEQEARYALVHEAMKKVHPEDVKVSDVNFDLLVRGIVCAEMTGPTAIYTNDSALLRLLPPARALIESGIIIPAHPLDFYTSRGLKRERYEKDHSLVVPRAESA